MNIINILKQVQIKILNNKLPVFSVSTKEQKDYLCSLEEPKDNIERSYNQYLCQRAFINKFIKLLANLISVPIYYYLLIKYKNKTGKIKKTYIKAVFVPDGKDENIIPDTIKLKYKKIVNVEDDQYILLKKDIDFINKIKKRYSITYEFLLKNLIKIAKYRGILINYPNIECIIVCSEYSYTSSIMTEWCHMNNIEHINVMHGEKAFDIKDSFFVFDKCYIWDEYYKNLFKKLRTTEAQFIIEVPPALNFKDKFDICKIYDYTYYLQGIETKKELEVIRSCMMLLTNDFTKLSVRPHPRYSKLDLVQQIFSDNINIEDNNTVIEESILRTKNVISIYSTVLNQAHYNNVNVIIDDISNPLIFKKLKEIDYIFILTGKYSKLSDVIAKDKK